MPPGLKGFQRKGRNGRHHHGRWIIVLFRAVAQFRNLAFGETGEDGLSGKFLNGVACRKSSQPAL